MIKNPRLSAYKRRKIALPDRRREYRVFRPDSREALADLAATDGVSVPPYLGLDAWEDPVVPVPRRDPLADIKRRDLFWMLLIAGPCLLGPALAAVYAVAQWLRPGVVPNWIDGLVQGLLVLAAFPLILAVRAVRRRWIRRRQGD